MSDMTYINLFVWACRDNKVDKVERMIAEGVNVNARHRWGWPGLCYAMSRKHVETVKLLFSCSNIRLDTTDMEAGMTGLHWACAVNSAECVGLYLAHRTG